MALSHQDASEGFAEKGAGSAVLILDGVAIGVLVGWVDLGFWEGLLAGGTMVTRLTGGGTWGDNAELEGWGWLLGQGGCWG